ncbi:MAG: hypothetical protein K2R93_04540 [Gemmatimonadaceae bacterium]|nr:hypothetical protein [Gemmatimonadaceae bacterium]
MEKAKKILAPLLALAAAGWNAYGAVEAFQGRHWLRGAFDVVLALVLLVVAYTMYDTGKRFADS